MNNINLLYISIDAMSVTLMLLLGIQIVRQAPDKQTALLLSLICIGVISNIICSRDDYGPLIEAAYRIDLGSAHSIFNLFRNSIAGAFLWLCHRIFSDAREFPRWLVGLWVLQLVVEEPLHWLITNPLANDFAQTVIFEVLPSAIQMLFLVLALYWMVSSQAGDLIAPRRSFRILMIVIYVIQAFLSLAVERVAFGFGWVQTEWQYPIHVLLIGLGIPFTATLLFASTSPSTTLVLGGAAPTEDNSDSVDESDTTHNDHADIHKIIQALETDYIYHQAGLSVRDLAAHVAIPEYRLRKLIHAHMGFRNFNALLHHYRVNEVCATLEDPSRNTTPVLTLALSVGYQSINPFNRAFRELKGMTPTEYRRSSQQNRPLTVNQEDPNASEAGVAPAANSQSIVES